MGTLAGRVVLVAGASRGVGAAVAHHLAGGGARVVLAARDAAALAATAAACNALRVPAAAAPDGEASALAVTADLTREADVTRLIATAVDTFGGLDAVVLNAAVGLVGPIERFSLEDWRRTLDTNVTAAFLVARAVIPHLRARHGAIIAIGSEFSRAGFPGLGAYAASKWALLGLMHSLSLELRPDGIRVSSILPGGVLTDFGPDTRAQKLERQAGGEKFLHPEDVAGAVAFLLTQPPGVWTPELSLVPR